MARVLMIDDDIELGELATDFLALEGFEVAVQTRGDTGLEAALTGEFDIVILDVMLPKLGGFEVLRRLREQSSVPVLMLTAKGDDADRVLGLESGADDYLPKPFNPRELAARLRAILRRAQPEPTKNREKLAVGDLELDVAARSARCGGQKIELTGMEFDVLVALLQKAGVVVPRDTLFREVFDRKPMPFDRSIDTHISNLRRKLGAHSDGSERLKNMRGVGYLYAPAERLGEGEKRG